MKYSYPAIITKPRTSDFYLAYFPDFDQMTQGKSLNEVLDMAEDLLNMLVIDYEDDKKQFPEISDISTLGVEDDQFTTLILADSSAYREKEKKSNKSVKKTLSIPSWLNEKALEENINFSQTLQEALIEKLRK